MLVFITSNHADPEVMAAIVNFEPKKEDIMASIPTQELQEEFLSTIRRSQETVIDAINSGRRIAGWEVDRATRGHIQKAGYGDYFIHRTGHSIGTDVHSNGANMDDLEIHDERQILPNSCFSIEPGIYLPEFGVRSEVNVLVRAKSAEVTGKIQREIVTI